MGKCLEANSVVKFRTSLTTEERISDGRSGDVWCCAGTDLITPSMGENGYSQDHFSADQSQMHMAVVRAVTKLQVCDKALLVVTYRMWVAGRDSNCRDRKSSLCLSWCFCCSDSCGCFDSSSNSPRHRKNSELARVTVRNWRREPLSLQL